MSFVKLKGIFIVLLFLSSQIISFESFGVVACSTSGPSFSRIRNSSPPKRYSSRKPAAAKEPDDEGVERDLEPTPNRKIAKPTDTEADAVIPAKAASEPKSALVGVSRVGPEGREILGPAELQPSTAKRATVLPKTAAKTSQNECAKNFTEAAAVQGLAAMLKEIAGKNIDASTTSFSIGIPNDGFEACPPAIPIVACTRSPSRSIGPISVSLVEGKFHTAFKSAPFEQQLDLQICKDGENKIKIISIPSEGHKEQPIATAVGGRIDSVLTKGTDGNWGIIMSTNSSEKPGVPFIAGKVKAPVSTTVASVDQDK